MRNITKAYIRNDRTHRYKRELYTISICFLMQLVNQSRAQSCVLNSKLSRQAGLAVMYKRTKQLYHTGGLANRDFSHLADGENMQHFIITVS